MVDGGVTPGDLAKETWTTMFAFPPRPRHRGQGTRMAATSCAYDRTERRTPYRTVTDAVPRHTARCGLAHRGLGK